MTTIDSPSRPVRRPLLGRPEDPRWAGPGLLVLLAATAVLYLWGLGASGWANAYYSAAAQAGSVSWKAFFFGASDAAGAITVDKTPGALWPMALSARVFGVNSWSILVPQALMGVAAVGVLHAAVRRSLAAEAGPQVAAACGLLAGLVPATTPVAALMFRFNNPDALLVLLLTLGAYAMVRSLEPGGLRWLLVAGGCVGLGFLAKMLQAFLVVPAFALVYLVAAPATVRRRIGHLLAAGAVMAVAAGWWVAIVTLIPADSRPYIGGSQHNSVLELTLGYNGLGRLNGDEVGGLGNTDQDAGWGRMFGRVIGGQVSWLLPAALILPAAGLWATRRRARTDAVRAALLLWGGWLAVHVLVFSHMRGIFHEYYTVALAPAIGALVGLGTGVLWRRPAGTAVLAGTVAVTALWSYALLERTPDFVPWLRWAIVAAGVAAVALMAPGRSAPRLLGGGAALAVLASLAGPAAYAVETASTPHQGAIPIAGPQVSRGPGFPGDRFRRPPSLPDGIRPPQARRPAPNSAPGGFGPGNGSSSSGSAGRTGGSGPDAGLGGPGSSSRSDRSGSDNDSGNSGSDGRSDGLSPGDGSGGWPGGFGPGGGFGWFGPGRRPGGFGPRFGGFGPGGGMGGAGGLLNASTPSAELTALLKADASACTWVAAAVGSNRAAGYQLATGKPVMAVGGFNGTDPAPTLEQFQRYVREKKIHYFIGGGMPGRAGSGSDAAQRIAEWVQENFTAQVIDGVTLYDLTAAR